MQKDIPSEEIKTGEEDDDDNGDNLLKDSNDSEYDLSLLSMLVFLLCFHVCLWWNTHLLYFLSCLCSHNNNNKQTSVFFRS